VAWNALRESALKDSIVSKPPPAETGRLRKIANMVRFVRRSSIATGRLKVPSDDISYNDTFIVSVRKLFFELFLINRSFLFRLVHPSVNQLVCLSVYQSVSQSASQSVSQLISQSEGSQSVSQSVSQLAVSD